MSEAQKTIAKMKKATDLSKQAFHQNGPKSFKNGVGAMVFALYENEGTMTQRQLVDVLGMGRKGVKTIVKKAVRSELVVMGDSEEKKTYTVTLTDEGKKVAEKRMAADKQVAEKVLAGLTDEEVAQLEGICDKIIVNVKDMGIEGKKKVAFKHRHRGFKRCGKNKKRA